MVIHPNDNPISLSEQRSALHHRLSRIVCELGAMQQEIRQSLCIHKAKQGRLRIIGTTVDRHQTQNCQAKLTLMAGMQTVSGYRTTYQPAQKKATGKATITRMTSQIMNHSGFAILNSSGEIHEHLEIS